MVASIRELGNISLSTSATYSTTNNMTPIQDNDMVVDPLDNLLGIGNKFDEMRGCSLAQSTHRPRFPSMSFVIRRVCGQTWTRVRIKYYNY